MKLANEKFTKQEVAELWATYLKTRDASLRDQLIEHYIPFVQAVAMKVHMRLGRVVEIDDLISSGQMAMMGMIDAFDPARGFSFESFCVQRVRGAMIDDVRNLDWVPRSARQLERQRISIQDRWMIEKGIKASDAEVVENVVSTHREIDKTCPLRPPPRMISTSALEETENSAEEVKSDRGFVVGGTVDDLEQIDFKHELKEGFLEILTPAERLIIDRYYFEGKTLKQIGQQLNLTEGRMSQIHARILDRLRVRLGIKPQRPEKAGWYGRSGSLKMPIANSSPEKYRAAA